MNASMFIYSDVEKLLHKWRLIETGAVDHQYVATVCLQLSLLKA